MARKTPPSQALAPELKKYETVKGTVRFPLDEPLPVRLIARIVKARLAELRTGSAPVDQPRARRVSR